MTTSPWARGCHWLSGLIAFNILHEPASVLWNVLMWGNMDRTWTHAWSSQWRATVQLQGNVYLSTVGSPICHTVLDCWHCKHSGHSALQWVLWNGWGGLHRLSQLNTNERIRTMAAQVMKLHSNPYLSDLLPYMVVPLITYLVSPSLQVISEKNELRSFFASPRPS